MDAIDEDDLKFKLPFGMVIGGPSSSGKTTILLNILNHAEQLFKPVPKQIVYAYGEYHPHVDKLHKQGVTVHAGLPSEDLLAQCHRPLLLILDDLMMSSSESYLAELFTKKSHHQNIGVIFLTQNIFDKNLKVARNNSQCKSA